ncbi:hypothetical protein RR46_00117 [Papilio xuthus]|uniref:Uncharacterized protein n=1 Tax=Papilio xuthus TaxID=66420 RepID=A0A0N1PFT3_PAPXU|nr:hypothetical protein RR46_00117 [Papilio xuthus]
MDTEIACSGYKRTRGVDDELLQEMGIGLQVSDDEDSQCGDEETDDVNTKPNYEEDEVNALRNEVEKSIMNDERKPNIEEITSKTISISLENEQNDEEVPTLVPSESIQDDKSSKIDTNSQKYRLAMIEKALSDVRSMRSYTSASTIAPDVVKQQEEDLNLLEVI